MGALLIKPICFILIAIIMSAYSILSGLHALGQALPEAPGGWAGWVGFITSGGVLVWFVWIRVPATDALMIKLMESKDHQMAEKDIAFAKLLAEKDKQIADKDINLNTILEHKWAAITAMSKDRIEEVKTISVTFKEVITELNTEHAARYTQFERLRTGKGLENNPRGEA